MQDMHVGFCWRYYTYMSPHTSNYKKKNTKPFRGLGRKSTRADALRLGPRVRSFRSQVCISIKQRRCKTHRRHCCQSESELHPYVLRRLSYMRTTSVLTATKQPESTSCSHTSALTCREHSAPDRPGLPTHIYTCMLVHI